MINQTRLVSGLVTVAALLASFTAVAQDRQAATWSSHKLDFVYSGFTSRFSCTGLEDTMRTILLQLGARKDDGMVVAGACSDSGDRPARIAGVHIKMATLQSADAGAAGAIDATWKTVTIGGGGSGTDCELIEQVGKEILPLFATRNVKPMNVSCIPNQPTTVPARLTLDVLVPAGAVK